MPAWARRAVYYQIVIDRFATGRERFEYVRSGAYASQLGEWMGGTLEGANACLDYLEGLGVNVLLLSPFFEGAKYHGYWPTDFLKVEPRFGGEEALRRLIRAAHLRDMRVVMDLPITHCHRSARLARDATLENSPARDWMCRGESGKVTGFFGDSRLPELNLENPEVIAFVERVIDCWLTMGIDGLRFDHAKRPSAAFWSRIRERLARRCSRPLLLGENWTAEEQIGSLAAHLHGELNITLARRLRAFARKPDAESMCSVVRCLAQQRELRQRGYVMPAFLDNHDMERISTIAGGNDEHLRMAYLLLFTLPYPPLVYYGSEHAQRQTANFPDTHEERDRYFREPMDWQQKRHPLGIWIRQLSGLRRRYAAWFAEEPEVSVSPDGYTFRYDYVHRSRAFTVEWQWVGRAGARHTGGARVRLQIRAPTRGESRPAGSFVFGAVPPGRDGGGARSAAAGRLSGADRDSRPVGV